MKMKVDKKLVDKVASLAKLEFDKEAKENMVSDMNVMISFIDKLEEIDTELTEPLVYMIEETNVLRADEIGLHSTPRRHQRQSVDSETGNSRAISRNDM